MANRSTDLQDALIVNALSRIDDKLDRLDDRMDNMSGTLVKQHVSLEEHMKRSDLLEEKIELETKKMTEALPKEVEAQIRLQRNKFLISALKVLGIVAGTGGAGFGLKEMATGILKLWSE